MVPSAEWKGSQYKKEVVQMVRFTSNSTGGLYFVVRCPAMLTSEGHHDDFSEEWDRCQHQPSDTLLTSQNSVAYPTGKKNDAYLFFAFHA